MYIARSNVQYYCMFFPSFLHTKLHWKYKNNYLGFLKYDLKKKTTLFLKTNKSMRGSLEHMGKTLPF